MSNEKILDGLVCDNDEEFEVYDRSLSKEAQRVVEEIKFGVKFAGIATILENSDSIAYINIRTLEDEDWCVELTASGYLIVAKAFDIVDDELKEENLKNVNRYETCEALMHQISPMFVKKFNTSVAERLTLMS